MLGPPARFAAPNVPALAEDVQHVERLVGRAVPEELGAWLAKHDGHSGDHGPFEWSLHGIVEAAAVACGIRARGEG